MGKVQSPALAIYAETMAGIRNGDLFERTSWPGSRGIWRHSGRHPSSAPDENSRAPRL